MASKQASFVPSFMKTCPAPNNNLLQGVLPLSSEGSQSTGLALQS